MPDEIVPDVYDITCRIEEAGNRYRVFLDTREPATLFDTGFEDTTDAVFEAVAAIGVEPERLVITHADGDHVGAFDAMVDRYGLETYLPEQSDVALDHEPDHRYGDGDHIGRWEAVHAPGHEPDNHVLVDEDAGYAVMGDAASGSDQRGLPEGYLILPPAVYSNDLNRAEESLERLLDFEFEAALCFHGSSVTEDARAKLDRFVNFPGKPG